MQIRGGLIFLFAVHLELLNRIIAMKHDGTHSRIKIPSSPSMYNIVEPTGPVFKYPGSNNLNPFPSPPAVIYRTKHTEHRSCYQKRNHNT